MSTLLSVLICTIGALYLLRVRLDEPPDVGYYLNCHDYMCEVHLRGIRTSTIHTLNVSMTGASIYMVNWVFPMILPTNDAILVGILFEHAADLSKTALNLGFHKQQRSSQVECFLHNVIGVWNNIDTERNCANGSRDCINTEVAKNVARANSWKERVNNCDLTTFEASVRSSIVVDVGWGRLMRTNVILL